ncbi:hypothetical protein GBA52_011905 [Prunus armeniaca]|nr:hypothetical protein GBA52_011905 [Prunus armeniaca]
MFAIALPFLIFYTPALPSWDVIAKHVLDYREDTVLAHSNLRLILTIVCFQVDLDASAMSLMSRVAAIPCEKPGPRVFKGFTVGFHPESWELVYDGMTQLGYEKSHHEFSFGTEQTHVTLYMTAIASLSTLVQRPIIKILPENGLEVKVSGSGATGSPPTTLSPTMLNVDWRCETARDTPYEVNITIPVEGYEPIQFFLAKLCENRQNQNGDSARGWAIFGVLSCIFTVSSTLFCCGGFIYKTQVERKRGIDALPGMTILSACLETVSIHH